MSNWQLRSLESSRKNSFVQSLKGLRVFSRITHSIEYFPVAPQGTRETISFVNIGSCGARLTNGNGALKPLRTISVSGGENGVILEQGKVGKQYDETKGNP